MRIDQQARRRMGMTERHVEYLLDIPQQVDQIRADDEVEFLVQVQRVDIGFHEFEIRISFAREADHTRRKIDTDAARWLQCRQEVATATAQFENAHSWRHYEAEDFRQPRL